MGNLKIPSLESAGILFVLLPGILAFAIVRLLTGRDKKIDPVEVVVAGLGYTLAINAIWKLLVMAGDWIPTPDIVGLSLTALFFSIVLSYLINRGWIYTVLTKCRVTSEPPFPSVWESGFKRTAQEGWIFATIELKDSRRLLGEIRFYSSHQENGHVALDRASWINSDSSLISAPGLILINADNIEFVQFLPDKSVFDDWKAGSQEATTEAVADAAAGSAHIEGDNSRLQSAVEQADATTSASTTAQAE